MSSRRRLRRKLSRSEFIQKLRVKCPLCGKTGAESEEEAWEIARRQYARFGGEMPKRVYLCNETGPYWHWTRLEQRPEHLRRIQP